MARQSSNTSSANIQEIETPERRTNDAHFHHGLELLSLLQESSHVDSLLKFVSILDEDGPYLRAIFIRQHGRGLLLYHLICSRLGHSFQLDTRFFLRPWTTGNPSSLKVMRTEVAIARAWAAALDIESKKSECSRFLQTHHEYVTEGS